MLDCRPLLSRSYLRRFALLAGVAGALLVPSNAAAALDPEIEQHLGEVADYVHAGGAAPAIDGVGCGASCQVALLRERELAPTTPRRTKLLRELLKLRSHVGEIPWKDRYPWGSIVGRAFGVVGAGILLGEGSRRVWLYLHPVASDGGPWINPRGQLVEKDQILLSRGDGEESRARDPVPYEDQQTDTQIPFWVEQPQSRTDLESRLRTGLEGNDFVEDWNKYAPQPDGEPKRFPDPTTDTRHDHSCDKTPPTYENPGGNGEVFTPKIPDRIPAYRPTGFGSDLDPHLYNGKTGWAGEFMDDWDGFGWRHIQAKHGWGPADEVDTRTALLNPATTELAGRRVTYIGQQYPWNNVVCQRRVVVDYADSPLPEAPPATPPGIITSYARLVD